MGLRHHHYHYDYQQKKIFAINLHLGDCPCNLLFSQEMFHIIPVLLYYVTEPYTDTTQGIKEQEHGTYMELYNELPLGCDWDFSCLHNSSFSAQRLSQDHIDIMCAGEPVGLNLLTTCPTLLERERERDHTGAQTGPTLKQ